MVKTIGYWHPYRRYMVVSSVRSSSCYHGLLHTQRKPTIWQALYFEYHVDYDIVTVGDYHVQEPLYGIVTQNLDHYPEEREPELDTGLVLPCRQGWACG